MRRLIILAAGFCTLSSVAAPSFPVRPPSGHPIIGKWQWTRDTNQCTEVYEFKVDGTVPVVSGSERTDNTYEVDEVPDINGFYKLTMTIVKDYGGKDCADDESLSSGGSANYIIFDPKKLMYLSCQEPKLERCFGPLRKSAEK
jgi:hypothetical protein